MRRLVTVAFVPRLMRSSWRHIVRRLDVREHEGRVGFAFYGEQSIREQRDGEQTPNVLRACFAE